MLSICVQLLFVKVMVRLRFDNLLYWCASCAWILLVHKVSNAHTPHGSTASQLQPKRLQSTGILTKVKRLQSTEILTKVNGEE